MKLYAMLEERGKPLTSTRASLGRRVHEAVQPLHLHARAFLRALQHAAPDQLGDQRPARALSEAPGVWIESGLAWVPFLMQRLDHEYMMRTSEAPLLKRKPSEYIKEMYFSSQPLERSNMKLTQATFEAINAETQLLFSSDWPHWDFDLPEFDHQPAVPERAGQAKHPRPECPAPVQP